MAAGTTFTGTTPNGTTITRTSKTKTYTHAVWCELGPTWWSVQRGYDKVGDQGHISFHTTEALAQKAANKWRATEGTGYAAVGVVPVTAN